MPQNVEIGVKATFDTQSLEQGAQKIDAALGEIGKKTIDPVAPGAAKKVDELGKAIIKVDDAIDGVGKKKVDPVAPGAAKKIDEINKGIEKMGATIGGPGRKVFDPVPPEAVKKAESLFQVFLKLDREMARRLKVTGQSGLSPDAINWASIYQNDKVRGHKLQRLNAFLNGGGAPEPEAPQHVGVGGGGGRNWKQTAAGMAAGAAQAGLRAAGPVGGVAANALGTSMSAGFGAGLAGLMGGLLSLGIGKLVGSVMEKIEQAENNNIAYDRLKRTLGDVNVSFEGLKSAVKGAGDGLNITYEEADRLAMQFAKTGNLKGSEYQTLPGELGVGVGLSRAFGLDPSQGVGVMGQMRGIGVTRDTQDSRRFALLIGETIAKSDAFAKADEVMEALAGYATAQTRQGMSAANVAGYGGLFSSMVGSGLAGMDPAGASSILARMNSALSAGGARGEASQFFTGMVANDMGLDPLHMQVLRENGMFATKNQAFGVGSAYTRYMGESGPDGNQTLYGATRERMDKQRFSSDERTDKLMRAMAFGNHTGLNMNQAMAMLSLKPNQMGEMQKYAGDLSKVSGSGIGNIGKALYGTNDDRSALAASLGARDDLTAADRDRLNAAMSSGNVEQQKQVLAKLSAQYEQERTQGSDIRDSRAALDNIKVNIADKMVPYLLDIKKGIIYLAGDGKKTPAQVMEDVAKGESKDRMRGINEGYQSRTGKLKAEKEANENKMRGLSALVSSNVISKEDYAKQWGDLKRRNDEIDGQLEAEKVQFESDSKAEGSRLSGEVEGIRRSAAGGGGGAAGNGNVAEFVKKHGPLADKLAAKLGVPADAILGQWGLETGWGKSVIKGTNNLGNIKDFSGAGPTARDNMTGSVDSYRAYGSTEEFGDDFAKLLGKSRYSGALGTKDAKGYFSGLKAGGYAEDPNYVNKGVQAAAMAAAARYGGTPLPSGGAGPGRGSAESYNQLSVTVDPLVVQHQDSWGREVRPAQSIQTRVSAPNPNTYSQ